MNLLTQEQIDLIISSGTIKTAKNEEFIISKYNDLEIVYRRKDMYINAGKMCRSQGRRINDLFSIKYWYEQVKPVYIKYLKEKSSTGISAELSNLKQTDDSMIFIAPLEDKTSKIKIEDDGLRYELDGGYQEFKGWYVHPKLINRIAQWCSVDYSFKVDRYMDQLSEELLITNKSFEQKLQEQSEQIQKLQDELNKHNQGGKFIEQEIEIIPFRPDNIYKIRVNYFETTSNNQKPGHLYIPLFKAFKIKNSFFYYVSHDTIEGLKLINANMNIYQGDPKLMEKVIIDIRDQKQVCNRSFKELNERDLKEVQTYTNTNVRNGLEFEIYCSNTFNIPRCKYGNPESIGLPRQDIGIDLFDFDNKISGQCKCYIGRIANNCLDTYFKCIDHINDNYQGWTHKLFILTTTKIPKTIRPEIERRNIEVVRVDFENELMKNERKLLESIKDEDMKTIKDVVDTAISILSKQRDETSYIIASDLVQLCKQREVSHNKVTMELRQRGYKPNGFIDKETRAWIKESANIQTARSTMKDDILKLIKPIRIYDTINQEDLKQYCKERSISTKDKQLLDSLNELGFKSSCNSNVGSHLGWTRLNPQLNSQLNNFLQNEIQQFIHTSERENYEYISLDEIKKYCSTHPDKPFDRDLILEYIKSVLQFNKYQRCYTKENYGKRLWYKPL